MSRKIAIAMDLVYQSLDILAAVDSPEGDQLVGILTKAAALLEGAYVGDEDVVDPDDDDSVEQYSLNFNR